MTIGAAHRVLDLPELELVETPCADILVELPAVATGSDLTTLPVAVEHRAAGDDDGWHVAAREPHDARRRCLVTPGQQNDAVEWIAADRLLDVHRHQVPIEHGGRLHQRLAEREHRELEREAPCLQDSPLHRHRHVAEVRVAIDELAPAVADADQRPPLDRLVGEAFRLHPAAMQESVEAVPLEPVAAAVLSVLRAHLVPSQSALIKSSARSSATRRIAQEQRLDQDVAFVAAADCSWTDHVALRTRPTGPRSPASTNSPSLIVQRGTSNWLPSNSRPFTSWNVTRCSLSSK